MKRHHLSSPLRRGLYSLALISLIMIIGTAGMCWLEGMSVLDSFYFMSMIATSQGPMLIPKTAAGKLFAALMAFVSFGAAAASIGFLFGPFFGRLWRIGVLKLEEELHLKPPSKR